LVCPYYNVLSIGQGAFNGCYDVTSVYIPASVYAIGEQAFGGCPNLSSITVATGSYYFSNAGNCLIRRSDNVLVQGCNSSWIPEGVTAIGYGAFRGCNIGSVSIPEGVTSIGNNAFADCANLSYIYIPDTVTFIDEGAFYCSGLSSVYIPASVQSIGYSAFLFCDNLSYVEFEVGSQLTFLDGNAFAYCVNLTEITIPASLPAIGDGVFNQCYNLTTVYVERASESGSITELAGDPFYDCTGLSAILVPDALSATAYKAAANWSHYAAIITY